MIFTCVPDIHNNWIALINLTANSLIAKPYTLEIFCTCFCGRDNATLASDFIKDAANKPRIGTFLASVTILTGNLLNRGINLWYIFSMCKIKINYRSKRRQSAIIIFTIVILVKTTKILKLISYQATTLLYDLLLQMVRVGRLERPISTSQMWRLTNQAIPGYMLGFAPCARRVERHGLRTRTSLHLAGYYHSPKINNVVAITRFHGLLQEAAKSCYLLPKVSS